ncbi:unknown [Lactobacillus phage Lb338-1]|uniref:Uncharacterized protein n=1 Tax=Lactobacillus phage Lb338-1 TaxID=2892342 RepID=C1KFV9_9CAUD|nr:hypothetical protein lb338_phage_199 [Lactobacillus phage Lb338-1]ACO37120.1 unknown [Lactobacillus phage Lb338-1]
MELQTACAYIKDSAYTIQDMGFSDLANHDVEMNYQVCVEDPRILFEALEILVPIEDLGTDEDDFDDLDALVADSIGSWDLTKRLPGVSLVED